MSAAHSLDRSLRIAMRAAVAAGDILRRGMSASDKAPRAKAGPNDPVTVYDQRAERAIADILGAEHPDDAILSEESIEAEGVSGRCWVIDPLDGTHNFLAGIPHFAVSIALAVDEQPILGCVHDPIRGETYTALRGRGAFLNGRPIHASARAAVDGAVVAVGLSHDPDRRAEVLARIPTLARRAGVLRTLGSAALDLSYVAGGRVDATWYLSLHRWDVAAGTVLVEEAGGRMTGLDGEPLRDPRDGVVASNGQIHERFLDALA